MSLIFVFFYLFPIHLQVFIHFFLYKAFLTLSVWHNWLQIVCTLYLVSFPPTTLSLAIVSFYPFLKALLEVIAQIESCLWLLSVFGQRWSIQTVTLSFII